MTRSMLVLCAVKPLANSRGNREREGIISGLNHWGGGVGVNALWKERSASEGLGWMRRRLRSAFSTFMPRKTFSAETNSLLDAR
jgi:hypothetical protein